jgi:uroporphyrinogen decarboxylase
MSSMYTHQPTKEPPRLQVLKAIAHQDPAYVPAWYDYFAQETRRRYGSRLEDLLSDYGDDVVFAVLSTFPPADEMYPGWTDEWGCSWNRASVGAISTSSPLSESWDRLPGYLEHGLPGLGQWTDLLDRVRRTRQAHPDRYLVATTWLAVFERLRALRGAENILIDLYRHPEELVILRDAVADEFLDQAAGAAVRGADAILLADDFGTQASLLISPDHWRRFFRPCYERMVSTIHDLGLHAWFHSCGNIHAIIPDLVAVGFDVLHPLQPSAMDLAEIRETFGGQICFAGGVDVQALLPQVGPAQVIEEIERIIDTLDGPHGGCIIAPTNSIMPDTPFENIVAMCCTMRDYGRKKRRETGR